MQPGSRGADATTDGVQQQHRNPLDGDINDVREKRLAEKR
jgi:hypothetical protein